MKLFYVFLALVSGLTELGYGRDLHLIDGRVFQSIQTPKQVGSGQFKFLHSGGVASLSDALLSRADFYEFGFHETASSTRPILAANTLSSSTPAAPTALSSSESGWGSTYTTRHSDRNYSSRTYSSRSYAPAYTTPDRGSSSQSPPEPLIPQPYYYPPSEVPNTGPVHVKGYYRKDGTYVRPHSRRR